MHLYMCNLNYKKNSWIRVGVEVIESNLEMEREQQKYIMVYSYVKFSEKQRIDTNNFAYYCDVRLNIISI